MLPYIRLELRRLARTPGLLIFAVVMPLGLSIAGGLWLPLDVLPGWLASVGDLLPTHAYADMSWRVAFGGAPTVADVVTLAFWLVAFGALAVAGYRRSVRSVAAL